MTYIWAHRGASGYAPENTLESFKLADEMLADGIELDVQLTKDGHLVVCHDETIDRTSNGKGFIKDFTLNQLKELNFNNHNEDYNYCSIPTLEEVLQLVKPTKMIINIELKTGVFEYSGIEEKTIELVEKYDMSDRVIYSSFNHYSILKVKKLRPQAKCGFLHMDVIIDMAEKTKEYGIEALHPIFYFLINQQYVNDAQKYGLELNCWTINKQEDMLTALKMGINAMITNFPDKAREIKESYLKSLQK